MAGALEASLHVFSSFSSSSCSSSYREVGGVSACTYERLSDRENREIDRERVSE